MLKFQYNDNTKIENFEEFILSIYVIIDELYKKYAPDNISKRRNKDKAKLSDAEIIAISICGELIGINSENANYWVCTSKKEVYFGYKVHAMITLSGFITKFEITPASIDDRQALLDMLDGESNIVILADKGYVGVKLSENLKNKVFV